MNTISRRNLWRKTVLIWPVVCMNNGRLHAIAYIFFDFKTNAHFNEHSIFILDVHFFSYSNTTENLHFGRRPKIESLRFSTNDKRWHFYQTIELDRFMIFLSAQFIRNLCNCYFQTNGNYSTKTIIWYKTNRKKWKNAQKTIDVEDLYFFLLRFKSIKLTTPLSC